MAELRKLIGSIGMLTWIVVYVGVAAVIGDRIAQEHWAWKLVYFPAAGLLWVLPLRPVLRWMHERDPPLDRPDV